MSEQCRLNFPSLIILISYHAIINHHLFICVKRIANCSIVRKFKIAFAVAMQLILAIVAFASLTLKRLSESPKRPLLVWY
jgi:hypothetical protein